MRATEELRSDHGMLRQRLALLENLMPVAPLDSAALREVVGGLARSLAGHAEKEQLLLGILQERLGEQAPEAAEHLECHRRQQEALDGLRTRISDAPREGDGALTQESARWINDVRESLASEEETLFPLLDRLVGEAPSESAIRLTRRAGRSYIQDTARPPLPRVPITEDMTIHRVLRMIPKSWAVLEAFQISPEADGPMTIEELAWRRGVDVDALLLALNQLGNGPAMPVPVPSLFWQSCDGLMLIDEHRRILAINPVMERLLNRPLEEVVGRAECGVLLGCQDREGCPLADHPDRCPGLLAMQRLRSVRCAEYSVMTPTGQRRLMSASYTPIQSKPGGPVWAMVVLRDMALYKRREQQLTRRTAQAGKRSAVPAPADDRGGTPACRCGFRYGWGMRPGEGGCRTVCWKMSAGAAPSVTLPCRRTSGCRPSTISSSCP